MMGDKSISKEQETDLESDWERWREGWETRLVASLENLILSMADHSFRGSFVPLYRFGSSDLR